MPRKLKLPWINLTWNSESGNQHTSLHRSLLAQLLFQQVCNLRCRAMNQQVTGSSNTEGTVMNVLRWQAAYCSRTMHRGAVDWVPESKCHKMEQRRKKAATNLSVQQASKPPGMKMEQVSGPTQEYKVINHPRMPGRVAKGYETKTTFHQRDKKWKNKNKNAWTTQVASFCCQTTTTKGFKSTEKSCWWRNICRLWKKDNLFPVKLALNGLFSYAQSTEATKYS